jgi:hypothetical protein
MAQPINHLTAEKLDKALEDQGGLTMSPSCPKHPGNYLALLYTGEGTIRVLCSFCGFEVGRLRTVDE